MSAVFPPPPPSEELKVLTVWNDSIAFATPTAIFLFFFFLTLQHHFRNYISFQELLWDVSADGGVRAERFSPAMMLSEGGNVTSVPPAKLTLWKWTLKCSRADLLL